MRRMQTRKYKRQSQVYGASPRPYIAFLYMYIYEYHLSATSEKGTYSRHSQQAEEAAYRFAVYYLEKKRCL
jgi:hypothetical protein